MAPFGRAHFAGSPACHNVAAAAELRPDPGGGFWQVGLGLRLTLVACSFSCRHGHRSCSISYERWRAGRRQMKTGALGL